MVGLKELPLTNMRHKNAIGNMHYFYVDKATAGTKAMIICNYFCTLS